MNHDRSIAELRETIPAGREWDFVRVEFDRAVQLAILQLRPVAQGWKTADETFSINPPPPDDHGSFIRKTV